MKIRQDEGIQLGHYEHERIDALIGYLSLVIDELRRFNSLVEMCNVDFSKTLNKELGISV